MRRVRQGDGEAASRLVRDYETLLRREIRTWLRRRPPQLRRAFDSLDVCQAVLATFFTHAATGTHDLESPEQLVGLLLGIARNKLAHAARQEQAQRRDVRRAAAV